MTSSIQQLPNTSDVDSVKQMIPIFIAKSKKKIIEVPNFVNEAYTEIQLDVAEDTIVDKDTIEPVITYWNSVFTTYPQDISGDTLNFILSDISPLTGSPSDYVFVAFDSFLDILLVRNVKDFTNNNTKLITLVLDSAIVGEIDSCTLIKKVTTTLPYTLNPINNILTVTYTDSFNSYLKPLSKESAITYRTYSSKFTSNLIAKITQDDIDSEDDLALKSNLKVGQSAVIVNYPHDGYLTNLENTLSNLQSGYYICSLESSTPLNNFLYSYAKTCEQDNIYKMNFVTTTLLEQTEIVSSSFTVS